MRGVKDRGAGWGVEVGELAGGRHGGGVGLVVDVSTDRGLLGRMLGAAGHGFGVVEVQRGSGQQIDAAFKALLAAARY